MWLKSGASKRRTGRLTKCSSTVAVTQQSWPGSNLYLGLSNPPPAARFDNPPFRAPASPIGHNLRAIAREISPPRIRLAIASQTDLPTHVAENRKAQFESHCCSSRSFDRPACATRTESATSDIDRIRAIASFLCGRHFLRAFSSRDDAACGTHADSGLIFHAHIRKTEQRRTQFVADVFDRRRN